MPKKLWIASDHAGFELKKYLVSKVQSGSSSVGSIEWVDVGPSGTESTDYPDWAKKLCEIVSQKSESERLEPCGVLICGSGVGMSIAANRFKGIRAVLALREDIAHFSRAHNASNVLCLGSRFLTHDEAQSILLRWLGSPFEAGRHQNRIDKIERT